MWYYQKDFMVSFYLWQKTRKYRREHIGKIRVRIYKDKKMSISGTSSTTINTSYYRSRSGSYTLGLDSYLDINYMHWDCLIKHDSDCKKCKTYMHAWCKYAKTVEDLDKESMKYYKGLIS